MALNGILPLAYATKGLTMMPVAKCIGDSTPYLEGAGTFQGGNTTTPTSTASTASGTATGTKTGSATRTETSTATPHPNAAARLAFSSYAVVVGSSVVFVYLTGIFL